MNNVRPGPDGVFFVESSSKRDTHEHAVNVLEGACTCTDFTARCAPRKRECKQFIPWPAIDRTACKHQVSVLLFLGLQVTKQLRQQARS